MRKVFPNTKIERESMVVAVGCVVWTIGVKIHVALELFKSMLISFSKWSSLFGSKWSSEQTFSDGVKIGLGQECIY